MQSLFREKVRVREPLVSLHWIFWGLNRLCDLKDQTTVSALQEVHGENASHAGNGSPTHASSRN